MEDWGSGIGDANPMHTFCRGRQFPGRCPLAGMVSRHWRWARWSFPSVPLCLCSFVLLISLVPSALCLVPSPNLTDLAIAVDKVFASGEFGQTHGSAGMEFLGGDTDFGAEPKLTAIGEPG